MHDILLVGCGNIGFRHLQALAGLDATVAGGVTVIEPNADHHPRIAALLDALPAGRREASRLLPALPDEAGRFSLAIIATNAAERRSAYDAARARASFASIVFEKVLFPRLRDYDEVAADLGAQGLSAQVNCPRRAAPGYRAVRDRLAGRGPVHLDVAGTAYGLGSNAVHFLDLAEYLNRSALVSVDATGLQPGYEPSKRPGYVEIFGTLCASLANGAQVRLLCDRGAVPGVAVTLRSAEENLAIEEAKQSARRLPHGTPEPFAMRHVSELTAAYADLLAGRGDGFSPFADSARQHRHLIPAVLRHLGLPVTPDTACPIS